MNRRESIWVCKIYQQIRWSLLVAVYAVDQWPYWTTRIENKLTKRFSNVIASSYFFKPLKYNTRRINYRKFRQNQYLTFHYHSNMYKWHDSSYNHYHNDHILGNLSQRTKEKINTSIWQTIRIIRVTFVPERRSIKSLIKITEPSK